MHMTSIPCFTKGFEKMNIGQHYLYICAWIGHVMVLLMVFLKNALMCIKKSQIN